MTSLNIRSVTFEHHPNGFGVGHREPRISWSFGGSEAVKGWLQESYDIQIGQSDSDEGTTHHVESSQSVLVPWPSNALQSRTSAWVKVRAHGKSTDADGNRTVALSTEWSKTAVVEAALLERADWTAKLTSAEAKPDTNTPIRPTLFRRTFTLAPNTSKIAIARLYITAHGVYKVYLNGHLIGSDEMAPGWTSYKHRLPYQIHDVAAALRTDAPNVLGIEVAEGWFAGKLGWEGHGRIYGDRLAFLSQLEVAFQDGQNYKLESDSKWKCSPSPITRSEIYDGEEYDSREEQIGWTSDANLDESGWTSTEELEFPSAGLVASDSPQVRVLEEIRPVKIFKSKSGKALIDFGQNLVGKLQVKLPAATSEAHKLTFRHAEVLEHDELGTRPLREAKATDVVILSPSQPELWSPKFTFHGFRYVQVDGWPTSDGLPTTEDLTALVMHSDMARTGWFTCSEPLVNQLHENAVWSLKGNFFSIPTDCPQRDERLGWTGDIQVFTPSAAFLYNVNGFLHSWLADVAVEQLQPEARGIPGLVVPNILDNPNPPGPQCAWHDVTVLTPWDLFNSSGDAALLRKQYASMKAWVDQGLPRGENGLWDQNVWQYGDWLDPSAPPDQPGNGSTDSHLIADAYLVRVLDTIAKVSVMLGEAEDAARYTQDAAKTRKTFQDEYVTASGLVVGDTATAYSLAIMFGLTDRVAKAGKRLSHVVHRSEYRISTGFVGTPLVSHALSDTGNHQVAYRMLLEKACPSWLYPVTMGATTIWERWDSMLPDGTINPGSMTSFNHYALGSVVNWMHNTVGGISPLEPGWKRIKVKPVPGGTLTNAKVTYEGPYGRVECSWMIHDGKFTMNVAVPPNSEAVVILPSDATDDGVVVGSGRYVFECRYEAAEWPPKPEFKRSAFIL